ncbi:Reverse transcriptase (RNA-dependent DNA polymerase) [Popillia japonica]|uniref:Reverse transcriptase (RNA-dependent DNA polymerase) n=1 Tax=Popillia japonica TaxID=7064 RepID=A0AAW1KPB3_POPJA
MKSCVRKIFEVLIRNRTELWCEHHLILDSHQFGLRRSRSTLDNLTILTSDILKTFAKEEVLCAFLDISAAYDNVLIPVLSEDLIRFKIPRALINSIIQLMSEKVLCLKPHPCYRTTFRRLPQGSNLSLLLYNICIHGWPAAFLKDQVSCLQYVGNIVLYISGSDSEEIVEEMYNGLKKLGEWLDSRGLQLSTSKFGSVWFLRKRYQNYFTRPRFRGNLIPSSPSFKF